MVAREVMERDEREGTVSGSIPSHRERETHFDSGRASQPRPRHIIHK